MIVESKSLDEIARKVPSETFTIGVGGGEGVKREICLLLKESVSRRRRDRQWWMMQRGQEGRKLSKGLGLGL